MTNHAPNTFFITLFILFMLQCFHLAIYPYGVISVKVGFFVYLFPLIFFAKANIWKGDIFGKKLFVLYLIFSLINVYTCNYYRGQKPLISLCAWGQLYYIFYYLTFRTWNRSVAVWETVIERVYIILIILYALKNIFIDWDFIITDVTTERLSEDKRVRIFSDAFLELGYLYSLNKFLVQKNFKYLVMMLLGFLFIFLQGFRTMMTVGVFVSIIMAFRVYKLSLNSIISLSAKFLLFFIPIIFISLQIPVVKDRVEELVFRNESQNFDNEDYIRIRDIDFTYTHFFKNKSEMFLGAGRTIFVNLEQIDGQYTHASDYSRERTMLATNNHYYPVDLGFLGLSWETGIPFTLIAILLFLNLLRYKVESKYYYASCYGLYMILIGFTNAQGYYQANLICLALAYTIVEIANRLYKKKMLYQVKN